MKTSSFYLAFALVLSFCQFAHSQDQTGSLLKFGLGVGGTFSGSNFNGTGTGTSTSAGKATILVPFGVHMEYALSDVWSLQPGIMYNPIGTESDYAMDTTLSSAGGAITATGHSVFHYHYLEIPLLAKANYSFGKLRLSGIGGMSLGYLLSAKGDTTNQLILSRSGNSLGNPDGTQLGTLSDAMNQDLVPLKNRLNYSLTLGTEVTYPVTRAFDLYCSVHYNLGLVDIDKDANTTRMFSGLILIGPRFSL